MTKPAHPLTPDPAIGPLDEHGQQILSTEEEVAIAKLEAQPWFERDVERALAEESAGLFYSQEEVTASLRELKRKWFADKGITPPPGYFDR